MEPFLVKALAAAIGLAVVAAPLGCVVVWSRMAYFGETIAQASLIGVALGLMLEANMTLAVVAVTLAAAFLLTLASRQRLVAPDSILGLMHHATLALGLIAASLVRGPSVDLMGYLFGDVFAVTQGDILQIVAGGILVLAALAVIWRPLLRIAVHEELARAEGVPVERTRTAFTLLLALVIAVAMKIVGILLVIAFLIVPSVAARPLATTPERMALIATFTGAASALLGLLASVRLDTPGGPSIVLVMSLAAALSLGAAVLRQGR